MTRDEAFSKLMSFVGKNFQASAHKLLADLVEIGLLHLEDGPSPRDRAADIIADLPVADRQSNEIIAALEAAGLEIVERKA